MCQGTESLDLLLHQKQHLRALLLVSQGAHAVSMRLSPRSSTSLCAEDTCGRNVRSVHFYDTKERHACKLTANLAPSA